MIRRALRSPPGRGYAGRMRTAWIVVVACLLAAVAADAKRLHLRKPVRGFQMRMESFTVQPDGDREGCEHMVTPNDTPMDVAEFQINDTPGTHHFVVWEYLGASHGGFWTGIAYAPGCVGLGPQDGFLNTANLFGMLSGFVKVRFPPGIAVRLEPHADVYADLHFHDYGTTPVATDAVFNFVRARKGTVKHHAQALTVGSANIDIPANGSASLTGVWHTPVALNLVQLSTHQHHRGTDIVVHRIDAGGNDLGMLVDSPSWEHPDVTWWNQALRLEPGEGLRFTCSWQNADAHPVHFGVTTEDEMCFVTGYFYPDDDEARVTAPGCLPQGAGLECFVPGS